MSIYVLIVWGRARRLAGFLIKLFTAKALEIPTGLDPALGHDCDPLSLTALC